MIFKRGDKIKNTYKHTTSWKLTKPGIFLSYLKSTVANKGCCATNTVGNKVAYLAEEPTELCLVYLNGNVSLSKVYVDSIKKQNGIE